MEKYIVKNKETKSTCIVTKKVYDTVLSSTHDIVGKFDNVKLEKDLETERLKEIKNLKEVKK